MTMEYMSACPLIVCGMMAVVSVAARDEETSDDNRHWYDGED